MPLPVEPSFDLGTVDVIKLLLDLKFTEAGRKKL
jgi:hypothetical protein